MKKDLRVELAESIPFSRANASSVIQVRLAKLNNWIDRNQLWQTDRGIRFHRTYTISEIFDLAGFAQMRLVGIPEQRCASFVRNYGFYRSFLASGHGEQFQRFSWSNGEWQIGVFQFDAILEFSINMRALGVQLFGGLANQLISSPESWPKESLENFAALYRALVEIDRLPPGSVPLLELEARS